MANKITVSVMCSDLMNLERDIKMTNRIALIAVGVCVVAAAVALIMHFLL